MTADQKNVGHISMTNRAVVEAEQTPKIVAPSYSEGSVCPGQPLRATRVLVAPQQVEQEETAEQVSE